jgi:hypothetical protein
MSSNEEFNETFTKFHEMYESCVQMLDSGIEFETSNEEMVRCKLMLHKKKYIKYIYRHSKFTKKPLN